jgi:hypothetical protein
MLTHPCINMSALCMHNFAAVHARRMALTQTLNNLLDLADSCELNAVAFLLLSLCKILEICGMIFCRFESQIHCI